jgi:hypothetical protein
MWKRIVQIDYEEVADHLLVCHALDTPVEMLTFEQARNILAEHVELMMDESDYHRPDEKLTDILFRHYTSGTIVSTHVTTRPGAVVIRDGHPLKLPLVLIELEI